MSNRGSTPLRPLRPKTRDQDEKSSKEVLIDAQYSNFNSISPEDAVDQILENLYYYPTNQAIEIPLKNLFESSFVSLWIHYPAENCFFSPSLSKSVSLDQGVIAHCYGSKTITMIESITAHHSYSSSTDGGLFPDSYSVLIIPILGKSEVVRAIIEFARPNPFNESNHNAATYISNKLKLLSKVIFDKERILAAAQSVISIDTLPKSVSKVTTGLIKFFKASSVEFYLRKVKENIVYRFDDKSENPIVVNISELAMQKYVLFDRIAINERKPKFSKVFDPQIDGDGDAPILAIPFEVTENRLWSITLRGRTSPSFFSKSDESILVALAPFITKSLCTALQPPSDLPGLDDFQNRLAVLLEIAETLSGVLDIDTLIPTIMERACQLLHAERCSLFLVDKGKQELVTRFHGGLSKAIHIPIARGIVGHTAMTGSVVNIKDAYDDPRFDRSVDQSTGFRTVSLLTVPIFNNRGEITGVTEMINKANGESFTDDDVRMMMAFNVFCGISLDNAKLYKASLDMTQQLRRFTELSNVLAQTKTIETICEEILENARSIVSANRATLFIFDSNDHSLKPFVHVGNESHYGNVLSQEVVQSREAKLFDQDDIARLTQTIQLESAIEKLISDNSALNEIHSSTSSRVSIVVGSSRSNESFKSKEMVCCIPIMDSSSSILGVMELHCNWKVVDEDLRLLDCFSVFASVAIERNNLKDIAEYGQVEVDLKTWLSEEERGSMTGVPKKFRIDQEKLETIWTIRFDAPSWDGIGHIKVLFNIFERFGLLKDFNITNEKFFRFISAIRDMYKKVPYHNWRHAVDVVQFITYELIVSGVEKVLSRFELFGLMIAAICHDVNHDGFTNVYNEKAETPLGILFKNQSVMETHHCAVTIDIVTKEETNIFASLNPAEYKSMWNLILQLILVTDMAKHFSFLKEFNEKFDSGKFNLDNQENRVVMMQLLLKCGDISNVSRPFDLADKWVDVLCEEFFRQGDLEQAQGMEYTSPLNDREHLDKPKSQIGFYTFVCLPLFQAMAKAVPKLDCNVQQINSNLSVWKAAHEAKQTPA